MGICGSPVTHDAGLLPRAGIELIGAQSYLTSTFSRPRPALGGLLWQNRTSITLTNGEWLPADILAGYPQDNLDGTETVKVRSADPINAESRQFIRLEVTRP